MAAPSPPSPTKPNSSPTGRGHPVQVGLSDPDLAALDAICIEEGLSRASVLRRSFLRDLRERRRES